MENNKQKTAIQSFWDKIALQLSITQINEFLPEFEKAKKMHMEQVIEAHRDGNKFNGWALRHEHEQYYNETYGKE